MQRATWGLTVVMIAASVGTSAAMQEQQQLLTVTDVLSVEPIPADHRIAFGADAKNFGDLRLPEGAGPHPVAIMIHGGCWFDRINLQYFDTISAELTSKGIATWNIDYRGADNETGGWPNTFLDVGLGVDHLRELAGTYDLDLSRVITVGHSAGGHLALWAAGRHRIRDDSDLFVADPFRVVGVVSLGGAPELRKAREIDEQSCGVDIVDTLMGGGPRDVPERYLAGSPFQMLPLDTPQRHITGRQDEIVPRQQVSLYNYEAQAADDSELIVVPNAGHWEVVWPGTEAWTIVEREVFSLLGMSQ